ncbi:MAG: hypothetical protein Q8L52_01120 [bacterium]|nr:hypothetical protein [bacterium]
MFYHDLITQKSWQELKKLCKTTNFVLIGGWAVYLYAKTLKSKDIDILIEYSEIVKLKKNYDFTKNERLKKYEARREEIQIDVYLPHYSELGIPVEDLMNQKTSVEGFDVLKKEYLIALKLFTLKERGRTVKGQKDFLDLLSLFVIGEIDKKNLKSIINKYKLDNSLDFFREMMDEYVEISEINLNKHTYKKLKEKILK